MLIGDVDREILELFSENVAAFYSINQIAKRLGKKYPYIKKRVSALLDSGVLKKSILGSSYLCSLNLASDSAVAMLSMIEIGRRDDAAEKSEPLKRLIAQIKAEKAGGGVRCVLISKNRLISVSQAVSRNAGQIEGQDQQQPFRLKGLTSVRVSEKEFLRLLCAEGIVRDHLILYGFERYFEMVGEVEKELRLEQLREIG
jgi:DNA-binding Lrp family transcriptional regulator